MPLIPSHANSLTALLVPMAVGAASGVTLAAFALHHDGSSETATFTDHHRSGEATTAGDAVETADEPRIDEDGYTILFDGDEADLHANFRTYRQDGVSDGWRVIDGVLVRAANGAGDLISREQFSSVDFAFEFRISEGGNSGVFFWTREIEGKPAYWCTPEYQIIDNAGWGDGLAFDDLHATGASYALYPCESDATKPAGEWNTGRIVVSQNDDGTSRVQQYLNGVQMCAYVVGSEDWNQRVAASKFNDWDGFSAIHEGHLGLQDHGNEVAFRNLRARRLED